MSWFTSRYTALLEQQVIDLKQEIERLRKLYDDLAKTFLERVQQGEATAILARKKAADADKDEPAKAGNWIRSRDAAEQASDVKGINFQRPAEPKQRRKRDEE